MQVQDKDMKQKKEGKSRLRPHSAQVTDQPGVVLFPQVCIAA